MQNSIILYFIQKKPIDEINAWIYRHHETAYWQSTKCSVYLLFYEVNTSMDCIESNEYIYKSKISFYYSNENWKTFKCFRFSLNNFFLGGGVIKIFLSNPIPNVTSQYLIIFQCVNNISDIFTVWKLQPVKILFLFNG